MRKEGARAQLVVIATALLVFVVAQVAIAGPSQPTAQSGGGGKSKVKSLARQVQILTGQVTALTSQVAALQGKQEPTSLPPSGPASGDLTGSYPSPSLAQPAAPTSAGLADSNVGGCSGLSAGYYNENSFSNTSAGFYRDRQGRVFLQGLIIQCGSPAGAVFTLPAGFRPANAEEEPGVTTTGTTQVGVENTGSVIVNVLPSTIFGLDGISFRCSPSGANGCP